MNELGMHFKSWEQEVFGFGYGTGEAHTLEVLRTFLAMCEPKDHGVYSYDYRVMEEGLGAASFWLMLNVLCHADIIEYGTSPRFGWLTPQGVELRKYVLAHDVGHLYDICMDDNTNQPTTENPFISEWSAIHVLPSR